MDRKGILGLLICGILFAAHIYYSAELNREKLEEQRAAEVAKKEAKAAKAAEAKEAGTAMVVEGGEAAEGEETTARAKPATANTPEEEIRLETDKLIFVLTNKGGGVKYAEFKEQDAVLLRAAKKKGVTEADVGKVRLNRYGKIAVGEVVDGGVDASLGLTYEIVKQDSKSVMFRATDGNGLVIVKRWTLSKGEKESDEYIIDFEIALKNSKPEGNISLKKYGLHAGSAGPLFKGEDVRGTGFYTYDGGLKFKATSWFGKGFMRSTPRESYEKREEGVLYAGVSNQFFATLVSKKEPADATIWAKAPEMKLEEAGGGGEKRFVSMAWSLPDTTLTPDETRKIAYQVFMGPKDNKVVRQLGAGRGEVMHYGFFSPISRFLNLLLNAYHDHIFSKFADKWAWGFAVMLVTVTIRIVIWPLHNASTRTMKRMSKLQPLMAEIKEKYSDDPQKVQTETMKLYKEYDINPVGGCLPMFAQIPIFFGFYNMLRPAAELRGAEFLWVPDLSLPDTIYEFPFGLPIIGDPAPLNLLPILMMVTMFIQMQLTPKTGDAMQRRIFMLMPFMFFFFCYSFASALALYWTTQNIFSIGQTWLMQRQPEVDLKKRKPGKKSLMQKFAEKAEEAQRLQKEGKKPSAGQQPAAKPKKPRGPKTGG